MKMRQEHEKFEFFYIKKYYSFVLHYKTGSISSSRFVLLYTLPHVCFSSLSFLFIDLGKLALHCHDV